MLRWIFFDLGWTLVDETQAHRARWDAARQHLAAWGHDVSTDTLMTLSEEVSTDFAESSFRSVLHRLGLTESQRQTIANHARYASADETLYPGVSALLEELTRKYSLGVIANQSKGTEERLTRWGIRSPFSLVFASAEIGLSKPDPRIFDLSLKQAGCSPDQAVMVGDRLDNDLAPAKAQGWRTVRVLQGFARHQAPRSHQEEPDALVASISELPIALNLLERAITP